MADISPFIETVREKTILSELIGADVKLQRRGKTASGLCPFHNEKSPSFTVDDAKAFYHCFGCGAHGDCFAYIMNRSNLSFMEAVERLASRVGLSVPKTAHEFNQNDVLYKICEAANGWFESQLKINKGESVREYILQRGISVDSMDQFRLGFAPEGYGGLIKYLESTGFQKRDIVQSGLGILSENEQGSIYERFRGRLMFPIKDPKGRIIAFGGRILDKGEPKYLNSPETPIFDKSQVLYNFDKALGEKTKDESWLVVEGYIDVIMLRQYGFKGAVAPLGTALSMFHLKHIWKRSPEPILCFDGDSAGLTAAGRAVKRALPEINGDQRLRIALLPKGEDPASLLQNQGASAFQKVLDSSLTLSEFLWVYNLGSCTPSSTPEEKLAFKSNLRELCGLIADKDLKNLYWQNLSARFEQEIAQSPKTFLKSNYQGKKPKVGHLLGVIAQKKDHGEKFLLAILINNPTLIADVMDHLIGVKFANARFKEIARLILEQEFTSGDALKNHLSGLGFGAEIKLFDDKNTQTIVGSPGDNDLAALKELWMQIWNQVVHAKALVQEKKDSVHALKEEFNEEKWLRLRSLLMSK